MTAQDPLVQLVKPDGRRVHHPEFSPLVADVGFEAMLGLYRDLSAVRRIDVEAVALQRQGQFALWPPLLGQEAAQVGSARALGKDDRVFLSYREHAVAYCRGVRVRDLVAAWRGAAHTSWNPMDCKVFAPAIVVGSQGLHAAGYAMGVRLDGGDDVAIVYFGDGATSQGDISEALEFASEFAAPVVFFCQNNQWAISEPTSRQSRVPLWRRASGFGVPSLRVDGNDVLAVLAVTRKALAHAREGNGPVFVEALTYRMGPHTTSDDPTRYRDPEELESWRLRDPIDRVRRTLERAGALDDRAQAAITAEIDQIAAEFRAGCVGMPDPQPLSLFDNVYADEHPLIAEERDKYRAYLAQWEEAGA
ncbi:MAG: pyruvate dehydrogenase (acetyl-transferring) E1 component subunit alpha [Segniliparus sp.]|uniref:pyruvate dehydrogenase (acetyl-transferring) E1 component subunit alpha n=1 Tax=Segniliparus sp. TaxID=2804064 RepID=UPI003F3D01DB